MNRLDQFLGAIPFEKIAADIQAASADQTDDTNIEKVATMLDTYANESRVTLALIAEHLQTDQSILEVGAGLCFTSLFLKAEGYNITALEPAIGGFGMFEQLKNMVLAHHQPLKLQVITEPAQSLHTDQHGPFDLIFSNNVMEHIPDWQGALSAMASVLSAQGKMVHACPNYSIPYEPHYGTPALRYFPGLSRSLFLSSDADLGIWHSLNFITCRQIKKYCKNQQLHYYFQESLLYNALKRIDDDPLFKQRHQGMIANIATFIMRSGLGSIIKRIPPTMATPMIVEISKKE